VSDAKPTKGTGLEKAVAKLDAAFAALPQERRQALGLAIYRCYPAMKQYLTDVDQLFAGKEFGEALWSVMFSLAFILPRGKDVTIEKLAKAFGERAPVLGRFIRAVTDACTRPPIAITDGDAGVSEADSKVLPAAAP
jgi:hypothetical protein